MAKFNRLKELSVLYVEDELDVLEEVEDILSLKVGTLHTATNGQEGLDKFKNENIDIIITDIQMPVMDGLTMIEQIRKENEDIPIIITSAFNEVDFLKKAIDLHVDKYITKPIDLMQLLSVLDRASEVIFQKREVEQRDKILRTVLDMHPYYSLIVDEKNLEKLNNELLTFLKYEDGEEFTYSHIENEVGCQSYNSIEDLTSLIINSKNKKNETICLRPKGEDMVKYILKPYFFEDTHLFLIAFFEKKKFETSAEFKACITNKICTACKL